MPLIYKVEAHKAWDEPFVTIAMVASYTLAEAVCKAVTHTQWQEPRIIESGPFSRVTHLQGKGN